MACDTRCFPFSHLQPAVGALGLGLLLAGCTGGESYQTVTAEDADRAEAHADHDHDHHHEAPHGGHLIELGDHKYNAEVLLEGEPKQLVIYLLDAHAENAVAIEEATITFLPEKSEPISLQAQPQDGDAEGKSSRFVADTTMTDLEQVHGQVQVTIDGTEYTAALAHDHDHDHGEKHDHDEAEHKEEPAAN